MVWSSSFWGIGSSSLLCIVSKKIHLQEIKNSPLLSFSFIPSHLYYLYIFFRPVLYSIAGLGIAIVNDFKSIEGDRELGLQSLPVAFGVDAAKWICASSITLTQLGVALYIYSINEPTYALVLLGLLLPQIYFQATLLIPNPIENDVKYQASSQPFFVFGILATALCIGHHTWA